MFDPQNFKPTKIISGNPQKFKPLKLNTPTLPDQLVPIDNPLIYTVALKP